jgi:thiosulfate reductase cytochrome b subunit
MGRGDTVLRRTGKSGQCQPHLRHLPGAVYLLRGATGGHFRAHILPTSGDLSPRRLRDDVVAHLHFRMPQASGRGHYGVLQKSAYAFVVFVAVPLIVLTGLAMSPAVTAAVPALRVFGGYQSARTIHFFSFAALTLFALLHVAMVIRSGFRRQMRAMTIGD